MGTRRRPLGTTTSHSEYRIQSWDEIAKDIRVVAKLHDWTLSRAQVGEAVRHHLDGKAYHDACLAAMKRPSVRETKQQKGEGSFHVR